MERNEVGGHPRALDWRGWVLVAAVLVVASGVLWATASDPDASSEVTTAVVTTEPTVTTGAAAEEKPVGAPTVASTVVDEAARVQAVERAKAAMAADSPEREREQVRWEGDALVVFYELAPAENIDFARSVGVTMWTTAPALFTDPTVRVAGVAVAGDAVGSEGGGGVLAGLQITREVFEATDWDQLGDQIERDPTVLFCLAQLRWVDPRIANVEQEITCPE